MSLLVSLNVRFNSPLLPKQNIWQFDRKTTVLVETSGTLCVSGDENAIQVAFSPHPPGQCWVFQVNHLDDDDKLYFSVRSSSWACKAYQ